MYAINESFLPAGCGNGQWHPVGLEVGDQLGGTGLGLAGGKQRGQVVVQLGHQITGKAGLNTVKRRMEIYRGQQQQQ